MANGKLLEDAASRGGPEKKWLKTLALHYEVPYVDLNEFVATKEFFSKFPARVLLDHHLLPMRDVDGAVEIATCRLFDSAGLDYELRLATGMDFRPVLAPMARYRPGDEAAGGYRRPTRSRRCGCGRIHQRFGRQ